MYAVSDYHYDLPKALVAQKPAGESAGRRDASRLLRLDRNTGNISHRIFTDLPELIRPGDVLVVNDTAVVPARLIGKKETGGRVETLILDYPGGMQKQAETGAFVSECLVSASKTPKPGSLLYFDAGITATVIRQNDSRFLLSFDGPADFKTALFRIGQVPLPPYIKRDKKPLETDKTAYQTVYAEKEGAVAAPTAGLHFTKTLLHELENRGVGVTTITLHVGYGTFNPVKTDDIRDHGMHRERFELSENTAHQLNNAKSNGRRIIAVGTTCVRTLEHMADDDGRIRPGNGKCGLFIYPGYRFKAVDAMITNFHLPESTLLMLVSAFAGRENIMTAYQAAIESKYRFYSYGDAMWIE